MIWQTPVARAVRSRTVRALADWTELFDPQVAMVVWERPADPLATRFAGDVLARAKLEHLLEVEVADLDRSELVPADALAADPVGGQAFLADVRTLAQAFADLVGASRLGVRLLRLDAPMCPRFHTDFVGVRLLTTYCGPGTEWLDDADVDRSRLGHRSGGEPDERSGLLRPGAVVRQLPEGAVGLLKGEAWPGNAAHGVVHRSPAVRGHKRIVFSLDVLDQEGGFEGFDATGEGCAIPQAGFQRVDVPRLAMPRRRRGGRA